MKTLEITKKSFNVSNIEGAFLANKRGISFMFFDEDGDKINCNSIKYRSEINQLIGLAEKFAKENDFTFTVK